MPAKTAKKRPATAEEEQDEDEKKKDAVPARKRAHVQKNDLGQLLCNLHEQGYCVQRSVVPRKLAKQAAEMVQTLFVDKGTSMVLMMRVGLRRSCHGGAFRVP